MRTPYLYLVGGTVRDYFLHVPYTQTKKDLDFAVEAESFDAMKQYLIDRGLKIWQERPEFVTVRGQLPLTAINPALIPFIGPPSPHDTRRATIDADFTLCRTEAMYSDKRHPDKVTPAAIADDLARRDFTINAIAISEDGMVVDPFDGRLDAELRLLRTVGSPYERFEEDPLRMLRALRFCITKTLVLSERLATALNDQACATGLKTLPVERVRDELYQMFKHDTLSTLWFLNRFRLLTGAALHDRTLWLKPTTEA